MTLQIFQSILTINWSSNPVAKYLLKVNNKNAKATSLDLVLVSFFADFEHEFRY